MHKLSHKFETTRALKWTKCKPVLACIVVFVVQVETREDEEQSIKLAEILELLLAAGYFRARIKGLSPFDKVHSCL